MQSLRNWLVCWAACVGALSLGVASATDGKIAKYVRYQIGDVVSYGVIEGDKVIKLDGDLFGKPTRTKELKDHKPEKTS